MKNKSLNKNKILSILLCLLLLFTTAISFTPFKTFANVSIATDVLSDLQKDSSFNADNYPIITDKNNPSYLALEIIQIAESENKELYIYTYQPAKSVLVFEAKRIAMWTEYSSNGEDFTPILYDLQLVSSSGVFSKYLVKDFTVKDISERYYNISTIYRNFIASLGENVSGGTTDFVGLAVGQQWYVTTADGVLTYQMNTFETVEVEIDFVGSLHFDNGLTLGNFFGIFDSGDAWFLCFDVENFNVKKIYDAYVSYKEQSIAISSFITNKSEPEDKYVTLTDVDVATFDGQGLFSRDYTWNRISSSQSFVDNMESQDIEFDSAVRKEVLASDWVFAFTETQYLYTAGSPDGSTPSTILYSEISEATILRLHFVDIHNDVYNLGVVADIVTPDNIPDGEGKPNPEEDCRNFFEKAFAILAVIVLVWVLIQTGLMKYLIDLIIWLIKLPVRLVNWLASKIKQSKANKPIKQKKKAPKRKK